MIGQELQIVYGLKAISPKDAWDIVYGFLANQGVSSSEIISLYDKKMRVGEVSENIRKYSVEHFQFDSSDFSVGYGVLASWNHILISIENKLNATCYDWGQLVQSFVEKALFIQAWVSDVEFDFWQNADDPLQYEANGRSFEGLPLISNGLPAPLERIKIDTSGNPGRRVIRPGYVEAVGSCMWLTDKFWLRTGTKRKYVMREFVNEITEVNEYMLQLEFSDEPFSDKSSRNVQDRARDILYFHGGEEYR